LSGGAETAYDHRVVAAKRASCQHLTLISGRVTSAAIRSLRARRLFSARAARTKHIRQHSAETRVAVVVFDLEATNGAAGSDFSAALCRFSPDPSACAQK
jgi:hypothetical protein